LTVTAAGFAAQTEKITVAIGSQPTVRVILRPESVRQSVEVRDRGPSLASQPLETTSSTCRP
jgi:hypothetical protein